MKCWGRKMHQNILWNALNRNYLASSQPDWPKNLDFPITQRNFIPYNGLWRNRLLSVDRNLKQTDNKRRKPGKFLEFKGIASQKY